MPYRDPKQSRTYQREYKRLTRAGSCQTPGQTDVPLEFRLRTATDVLDTSGEIEYGSPVSLRLCTRVFQSV